MDSPRVIVCEKCVEAWPPTKAKARPEGWTPAPITERRTLAGVIGERFGADIRLGEMLEKAPLAMQK